MARLIIVGTLLGAGLIMGGESVPDFLDLPSLFITLGGTLAVTFLSFSQMQIRGLGKTLHALFREKPGSPQGQINEISRLAQFHRLEGPRGLESQEDSITDPFLRHGISMVVEHQRREDIREQLESEAFLSFSRQESARQILLTMGKLFPAFGLIGTLIGLVLLLRQIAEQDPHSLTSALSLALLTTLYGALFANLLVFPLAAKVQARALEREAMMRITVEGVLMLARGEAPAMIEQRLGTLLAPVQGKQERERAWMKPLVSRVG